MQVVGYFIRVNSLIVLEYYQTLPRSQAHWLFSLVKHLGIKYQTEGKYLYLPAKEFLITSVFVTTTCEWNMS